MKKLFRHSTRLLSSCPKNVDNLNSKGVVLAQMGRYNEAIKCFDKAIGHETFVHDPVAQQG